MSAKSMHDDTAFTEFVTFTIAGQMFGLPIGRVQDVFKPARITQVPLASVEIAGVLNLRGRIVTAIDMRQRLEVNKRENGAAPMAIGIEAKSESFGLLVDAVGEVLKLPDVDREPNPINLGGKLAALSDGVYRLEGQLLVVLDVDRVLDLRSRQAAA
ncbi:MAG: chemotaxis protein CheW [Xanthobacteraceae bacterium]